MPALSGCEKTQLHMQRYIEHFPAAGEIVIFDRSWYNRAGVEHVMGFCTPEQHQRFLDLCRWPRNSSSKAAFASSRSGSKSCRRSRSAAFATRIDDPIRQWKLSPMDLEVFARWYDYSKARDMMFEYTDVAHSRWFLVDSNEKKGARLNVISHILSRIPYKRMKHEKVKLPERSYEHTEEALANSA